MTETYTSDQLRIAFLHGVLKGIHEPWVGTGALRIAAEDVLVRIRDLEGTSK